MKKKINGFKPKVVYQFLHSRVVEWQPKVYTVEFRSRLRWRVARFNKNGRKMIFNSKGLANTNARDIDSQIEAPNLPIDRRKDGKKIKHTKNSLGWFNRMRRKKNIRKYGFTVSNQYPK